MRELCERFHREALHSSSGLLFQRVGRSSAATELRLAGRSALPYIAEHLARHESDPDFDFSDMRGAWSFLLSQMKSDLDPNGEPVPFLDTVGWIAWVTKITET